MDNYINSSRESFELYGINFSQVSISYACRNNKPYKGFHFEYI